MFIKALGENAVVASNEPEVSFFYSFQGNYNKKLYLTPGKLEAVSSVNRAVYLILRLGLSGVV